MIKDLFAYYFVPADSPLKRKFDDDFIAADKTMLYVLWGMAAVVGLLTPWQHGYFMLGIVGGSGAAAIATVAYLTARGTLASRITMALALNAMMAITIQQSHGLGEGHFIFFLNFAILIRYRDLTPVAVLVVAAVVHHLSLTYCQAIGATWLDAPLLVFSWGEETRMGLIAPLLYHVVIALIGLAVSAHHILDGNRKFIEASALFTVIERASGGDLTATVPSAERSALMSQLDTLMARLRDIFQRLERLTDTLIKSTTGTQAAAEDRSRQSKDQQQRIGDVASALEQLLESNRDIARSAEHAASTADQSQRASREGESIGNDCKTSIQGLAGKIGGASEIMSNLAGSSQQIDSIVETIRGIAEQTNLLALNAAIEAARAGDQGRGFAVVADEVRVLSQRTHKSTEEISGLIGGFRRTADEAVAIIADCHESANHSVEEIHRATSSFSEIAEAIDDISTSFSSVATATEAQAQLTNEVNSNTNDIRDTSSSLFESFESSANEAKSLLEQAAEMNGIVRSFRT